MGAIWLVAILSDELVCQIEVVLYCSDTEQKHRSTTLPCMCFLLMQNPKVEKSSERLCTVTTDLGVSVLLEDFFNEPEQKNEKISSLLVSPCCGYCHFPRQLSRSIVNGPGPQFEVEEGVLEWEEFKSLFYDQITKAGISQPSFLLLRRFRSCHLPVCLIYQGFRKFRSSKKGFLGGESGQRVDIIIIIIVVVVFSFAIIRV